MNAPIEARDWFNGILEQGQASLPDANLPWLEKSRAAARQQLQHMELPQRKQEAWRYTSIEPLLQHRFVPANQELVSDQLPVVDGLLRQTESYRLVFVDGRLMPALCNIENLEHGVRLASLRSTLSLEPELLTPWFDQAVNPSLNAFALLNTALINDGLLVHVPRGITLDKPVEVIYLHSNESAALATQLRNLIVLGEGARATLLERYIGNGDSAYLSNGVSEIVIEKGAELQHYRLQNEAPQAFHLQQMLLRQAAESRYQGSSIAMGARWARSEVNVRFAGEGADCELNGLYTVGEGQLTDHHLNVLHNLPNCSSRENYRGILYGKGRAVFDGRILVEQQAQQTDAQLSNKNLLLTRDAEVDTKPQLEIYADNVKCSHGTTVGQIDPNQLFYLRSRGIDTARARQMLCLGFADEVTERIDIEPVREHVRQQLVKHLV